ncbi:MAG TPA: DNA polymerase IV [Candidatus Dormibacteraeota bacterium]|nr:DNA polymerase IV [Candidatus Dormibacteraeota bacterium]
MRSREVPPVNTAAPSVLFLDLNSAFASIEQQYRPELRGRPVAVCPGAVRASAVISASREARALGVRTGMRVYQALPLCPDLLLVEPDPVKYREVSRGVLELLDSYSPRVLPLSIDEAAVDLAGTPALRRDLRELGREVKRRLREEVGDWLTCSVGFSTNVFLAKQAAELEKPDGLQVIDHRNLEQVFSRLQLTDLTGISEANAVRMRRAGIITPLHLLGATQHTLRHQVFGSIVGEAWYLRLHGFETESFEQGPRKTVSHSFVLPRPTDDPEEIGALILRLCDRLGRRLRQENLVAGRVELHVRTDGGDRRGQHRRQRRLVATQDIYAVARQLWAALDETRPLRAMAIALAELSSASVSQLDLFQPAEQRSERVSALLDELRDRFGERAVTSARLLNRGDLAPERIAFGKLPPVGG